MVAPAAAGAGAGDANVPPLAPAKKSTRTRGPALKRVGGNDNEAGPSDPPPRPSRLDVAIENLHQAYVPDADVQLCAEQLEEQRLFVLEEAQKVAAQKRELERSQREYASANGLAPVSRLAGRLGDVGVRGKNLHSELDRAARSGTHSNAPASYITPRPVYDTPAKNLRAAEAAAVELSGLTGEERRRQEHRVTELLRAANQQNAQYKGKAGVRASQVVHSAASSPKPKEKSVTSGQKNKQLQRYDPAFAGKQITGHGSAGPNVGQGSRGRGPNLSAERAHSAGAPHPRQQSQNAQPRYYQAAEYVKNESS